MDIISSFPGWIKLLFGTGVISWLSVFALKTIPQFTERKWRFSVEKFRMLHADIEPFLKEKETTEHERAALEHSIFKYTSRHIDYKLILKAYQSPMTFKNINILRKYGGKLKTQEDKLVMKKKSNPLPDEKKLKKWSTAMLSLYIALCLSAYSIWLVYMIHKSYGVETPEEVVISLLSFLIVTLFSLIMLFPTYKEVDTLNSLSKINKNS